MELLSLVLGCGPRQADWNLLALLLQLLKEARPDDAFGVSGVTAVDPGSGHL